MISVAARLGLLPLLSVEDWINQARKLVEGSVVRLEGKVGGVEVDVKVTICPKQNSTKPAGE